MNSNDDENALTSSQILHDLIFVGGTSTRRLQQEQAAADATAPENSKVFKQDPEPEPELKSEHNSNEAPKKRGRGRPPKRKHTRTSFTPAQESRKFNISSEILASVERQRGRKGDSMPFHAQSILLSRSVYTHPNRFQGLTDFAGHNTVRLFVCLFVVYCFVSIFGARVCVCAMLFLRNVYSTRCFCLFVEKTFFE